VSPLPHPPTTTSTRLLKNYRCWIGSKLKKNKNVLCFESSH
jgi:hypothetical protein